MANFKFTGENKSFFVTWKGLKMFGDGPVQVWVGEEVIGEFNSMDEIKAGKDFKLADGGLLRVYYKKVFWFIWAVAMELNGNEIKGSQVN